MDRSNLLPVISTICTTRSNDRAFSICSIFWSIVGVRMVYLHVHDRQGVWKHCFRQSLLPKDEWFVCISWFNTPSKHWHVMMSPEALSSCSGAHFTWNVAISSSAGLVIRCPQIIHLLANLIHFPYYSRLLPVQQKWSRVSDQARQPLEFHHCTIRSPPQHPLTLLWLEMLSTKLWCTF